MATPEATQQSTAEAIASITQRLASMEGKISTIIAQTSAIQNQLADLNLNIQQQQKPDNTVAVNETLAVASAVAQIDSDVQQVLDILRNPPAPVTQQGLA
jgi:phage-related tail protein